jgi:hypothetical protein
VENCPGTTYHQPSATSVDENLYLALSNSSNEKDPFYLYRFSPVFSEFAIRFCHAGAGATLQFTWRT